MRTFLSGLSIALTLAAGVLAGLAIAKADGPRERVYGEVVCIDPEAFVSYLDLLDTVGPDQAVGFMNDMFVAEICYQVYGMPLYVRSVVDNIPVVYDGWGAVLILDVSPEPIAVEGELYGYTFILASEFLPDEA